MACGAVLVLFGDVLCVLHQDLDSVGPVMAPFASHRCCVRGGGAPASLQATECGRAVRLLIA